MSNAQHEGATVRSFLIGTLVSLLIGLGIAYADNAIRGSYMAFDFGSPVAVFFLFVIVALLNPLAGWIRRAWFLSEAEITLVFIMALVAASIPAMGLTGFFLPYLSGAQYYASPENGWAELFMHYTPDWLIVQDQQAIKDFYEGNPQGASDIPWKAWLPSLLAWLPFLLALYLVMIASMVILRRQWMTHERLLYPLMQPSLALIAQEKGRLLPPLLRSALFWFGVGIPFSIGSVTALHAYYPVFPEIELYTLLPIFRGTTLLRPGLYFTTIGFTYFLSRDISLGIWLFNLLAKLQEGSFNLLGVSSTEYMEWVTVPILAHQNIGAMIVFVLFGLWMGRSHLRAVVRKAFRGDASVQDADEVMSYRTAVFLVLGGSGIYDVVAVDVGSSAVGDRHGSVHSVCALSGTDPDGDGRGVLHHAGTHEPGEFHGVRIRDRDTGGERGGGLGVHLCLGGRAACLRHGRLCQCAHDGGEDPRQTEDIAVGYAGRDSGQCARFHLG